MVTSDTSVETAAAPGGLVPAEPGRGPAGSRFTIRMDTVNASTSGLPDRQRLALRWIAHHCITTNVSHRDVAPKLKQPTGDAYSHDSLYHALTGGRTEEQLTRIVDAIERYKKLVEERSQVVRTGFIETAISRRIWKLCRKALHRQRVGLVYGDSQIGKTIALEEYARAHNHGETKYLRLPVGCGGFGLFLRLLAAAIGVPVYQAEKELRNAIMEAVDEHMLLIVDELHEPFGPRGNHPLGVKVVNFLREVYDRKHCGLVLCGTNVLRDTLTIGSFARNMQQIRRRSLPPLQLPSTPPVADLALFAEKFGLGEAPDRQQTVKVTVLDPRGRERKVDITDNPFELQIRVCAADGLGRWLLILEEASENAREQRRSITWGAVMAAHDSFARDASFNEEAA